VGAAEAAPPLTPDTHWRPTHRPQQHQPIAPFAAEVGGGRISTPEINGQEQGITQREVAPAVVSFFLL